MTDEHPAAKPTLVVGLVGDPGLPYRLAREIATDLAEELRREVSDQWEWRVEAIDHRFTADEQGELALEDVVDVVARRHQLDVVVCITDQPRRSGMRPIVADINRRARVAITSLPALGALRLRRRARHAVVRLVSELVADAVANLPPQARVAHETKRPAELSPFVRTASVDGDIDVRFVGGGRHSRARLLAGMVRANRPWLLVPHLSSAFAAAFAAGAVVLVTETTWKMAAALDSSRLAVAAVLAVATMVAWLIIDHELWERPGGRVARDRARLFNTATVLTVALGVGCLYVALLVATLAAEWLLITGEVLRQTLRHPVGWPNYVTIAWLASSIATVGGALGSGLESDKAVRAAAYGYRQQERRGQDPTPD